MPTSLLWQASPERIQQSQLNQYQQWLRANNTGPKAAIDLSEQPSESYAALHQWSTESSDSSASFWRSLWDFFKVIGKPGNTPLEQGQDFIHAQFFPAAELNFAENLLYLSQAADEQCALISRLENGQRTTLSYGELRSQSQALAANFSALGIKPGDRVAALMPNVAETVVGLLACTQIGAIWTSCSPDFGSNGIVDRFGQSGPKLLIACDGYFYNGKTIDCRALVAELAERVSSIQHIAWVNIANTGHCESREQDHAWSDLIHTTSATADYPRFGFNHPLAIMYSSGTTGKPKCIVHGAGGTLLQHLKEHQLHADLRRGDRFFYYSTCGWMMWNWLISGLASGATLVLYDGSPFYPEPASLIDMIDEENIALFGASAKYIAALEKAKVKPKQSHQLSALRSIFSTGSPLAHESFDYVYRDIKADVCLSSISGGTDILSCFALGNSCLPVYRGELQCLGLGMAVEIWDENAHPLQQAKGELVCTLPFPSKPIGFWGDEDHQRYRAAYFEDWPNIWAHGDYGEITANNGVVIHGRSDAVLNPGGVRIGTAEIYRQVEKLDDVLESLCIGQQWQGDVRVVLFVVLREGQQLSSELTQLIKASIRKETTPRHVPAIIEQVDELPRTISGKIVELAVRSVVHGEPVKNTDALANPEALELFRNLPVLQQ